MTARYDTEWSTTAGPYRSAPDSVLPVLTTAGPLWTEDAGSLPLDIVAGDCQLTVSGVTDGFADSFARTVSGGWGGPWIREGGSASNYAVTDGVATHAESEVGGPTRRSLLDLGLTDVDAYWTVSIPQIAAGVAAQAGLMVREDGDNSNFYIFRVLFFTDGRLELRISKRVNGLETTVYNPDGTQGMYAGGTQVHMRSLAIGARLAMKVWTDASPEPDWQLDVQDTTFSGPGRIGLRSDIPLGWTQAVPFVFSYRDFRLASPGMQTLAISAATPEGVTVPTGEAVHVLANAKYA